MNGDERLLKKRFAELHSRAVTRGVKTYSDFLTMAEQDALLSLRLTPAPELYGGFPEAERRLAVFGDADCYGGDFPAVCLFAAPLSLKFAQKLTHRDYLGAVMSLGVRRDAVGDIVITDAGAYIFCLASVAEVICSELHEVSRTPVRCAVSEAPESLLSPVPEERELVVSSERADALVAAVYRLSRSQSQDCFTQSLVFVNSRLVNDGSKPLSEGDAVSVRGHGRFVFAGLLRETKKGRLRALVKVFQ